MALTSIPKQNASYMTLYWVLFYFSIIWVLQIIRENAAGCCLSKTANLPFYKNGFSVGHGESREYLVARGRGFWRLWVLNLSGRRVSWVQNCIFSVDYKVTFSSNECICMVVWCTLYQYQQTSTKIDNTPKWLHQSILVN